MSMTVVATRNVSARVRGFLASIMIELVSGVYSAPRMSPAVRERVWIVLEEWFPFEENACIIMAWSEKEMPGGQSVKVLGSSRIDLVEVDGLVLSRRQPPAG